MASGTLEGTGPNKLGTTAGSCRELGFNGLSDSVATSPSTTRPKRSNPAGIAAPLVNMVNPSADTAPMDFPAGTFTGEGING